MTPPPLAPHPPLFIVFNPGSGRHEGDPTRERVDAACAAAGRRCEWFEIGRGRPVAQVAHQAVRAALQARGIAVAVGGDGTLSAVAQAALPAGCAFGVLPQGTFNYFGRDHGVPQELDEAVAALLAGHLEPVQAGQVNDRVFIVNASLGLYARVLADREVAKQRFGRSRRVAAFSAVATLLRGVRNWRLRLRAGGQAHDVTTPTLFVGNNALQFEQVGLAEADDVERGALAVVALQPVGRAAMFGMLLRAALGRLDDDPHVHSFATAALEVSNGAQARRVRVATDGELTWMTMPLRFRVAPQPLWLVKPPPALEAERA
ncbi:MAG: diacylglycerol kinase [Burkholderiaceae bacterium]|nr:diacylglycerol kinase [Burkholderiaceae bacterium]